MSSQITYICISKVMYGRESRLWETTISLVDKNLLFIEGLGRGYNTCLLPSNVLIFFFIFLADAWFPVSGFRYPIPDSFFTYIRVHAYFTPSLVEWRRNYMLECLRIIFMTRNFVICKVYIIIVCFKMISSFFRLASHVVNFY